MSSRKTFDLVKSLDLVKILLLTEKFTKSRLDCIWNQQIKNFKMAHAQYVVLLKWQSHFSQKTLFSKKGFNYFIDEGYGCIFAESFRVWLLDPIYKKGTK